MTGVYLLDGILGIADEAFAGCSSLEVIELPSTLVRIGKEAFRDCTSLKEIILPASLKFIDASAFEGCTSLEKVTFYEEFEIVDEEEKVDKADKADKGNKPETPEVRSKIETIGERAFFGCEALKEIILPENLKNIGVSAFNTPEMTIKLYITEENIPLGFAKGWCNADAIILYDFTNIPEEDEEGDAEGDDKDKNEGEKDDDKPFWEGLSL